MVTVSEAGLTLCLIEAEREALLKEAQRLSQQQMIVLHKMIALDAFVANLLPSSSHNH